MTTRIFTIAVSTIVLLVIASGCVQQPKLPPAAPFDETEYLKYEGNGSSTITGQAFMKTRAGDVKYGAGDPVFLNPVTSHSTAWWDRAVLQNRRVGLQDPRADKYTRTAIADGEGRFTFANLPAGDYYITCPISWDYVESGSFGPYARATGGRAFSQVKVGPGETVATVVTRR